MKWSIVWVEASWVGVLLCAPLSAQVTQRVSFDSSRAQADGNSVASAVSPTGRFVLFQSDATDLVIGDANGKSDVFVRDMQTGTTELVSITTSGTQGNQISGTPGSYSGVSADGRFVVFPSYASNLVPNDGNGTSDIFIRDRQNATTELVSVEPGGQEGDDESLYCVISPDGRYVAFSSFATNLVAGDTNDLQDVFVRDLLSGTTERVSVDSNEAQASNDSLVPSISADGRYVVFYSLATDLVVSDTNGAIDVFFRDQQLGTTELMSVDSIGTQSNGASYNAAISADGRYVAFYSLATNLVAAVDTNGTDDIFVHDRQTGITEIASTNASGAAGDGRSVDPFLSADGRYVVFHSLATDLVLNDTNGRSDAFIRDRQTGTTQRVSLASNGDEGNNDSFLPTISTNGRYVAFYSSASNLVPGDTGGPYDVFLRDRDATGFTIFCDPGVSGVIACPCSNPPSGSGRGCNNFGAGPIDSGTLTATGAAYLNQDTVVLHATGENNTSLTVFWQGLTGTPVGGVKHGAGVRCVSGNQKRLYTGSAIAGAISRPTGAQASVSARSAALGDPIPAGATRRYYCVYRDPQAAAPCGNTGDTINTTNAGAITWNL